HAFFRIAKSHVPLQNQQCPCSLACTPHKILFSFIEAELAEPRYGPLPRTLVLIVAVDADGRAFAQVPYANAKTVRWPGWSIDQLVQSQAVRLDANDFVLSLDARNLAIPEHPMACRGQS